MKVLAVPVVVLAVAFGLAVDARATHGRASTAAACAPHVHDGVLPVWMRAGFSGPKPRIPYVLGEHGAIGGILFAAPLNAPPAQNKNNKILWVARHFPKTAAALWIRMQKMQGNQLIGAPVRRIIPGGPGPSYVDATSAGCWRLTLTWSGHQDTLDLEYVPPTG